VAVLDRAEATMKEFLKATFVGGVIFLLPGTLILFFLSHAMRLAGKVAQPIAERLHLEQMGHVIGVSAATLIAVLVLIVVSFVAGLAARTRPGSRLSRWFEHSMLGGLPKYQMVKSMAEGLAQIENGQGLKPALVSVEDGWQIAYLLETLDKGWVAVFLPQAPTPMSGNVMYFPSERVRPLDITMVQATSIVKRIGVGSREALRGVDLTLPQNV
jgi:uncharacterized membrane protein